MTIAYDVALAAPKELRDFVKGNYNGAKHSEAYDRVSDFLWTHPVGQNHAMKDAFVASVLGYIADIE
jgi:hypothetical protein